MNFKSMRRIARGGSVAASVRACMSCMRPRCGDGACRAAMESVPIVIVPCIWSCKGISASFGHAELQWNHARDGIMAVNMLQDTEQQQRCNRVAEHVCACLDH
jgi:hypothetical protein